MSGQMPSFKLPCRGPAIQGRPVCWLHGGKGGGPKGERNGAYRTGRDTASKVFQAEPQLIVVQPLGTTPEAATLEGLHYLSQPVNLGLCLRSFAVERRGQFADHPVQRRDVVRQGSEGYGVHEPEFMPATQPAERYRTVSQIGRSAPLSRQRRDATAVPALASRCPRSASKAARRSTSPCPPARRHQARRSTRPRAVS